MKKTFFLLKEALGEDAFRSYRNGKFKGPFSISAYEAIIPGLSKNIDKYSADNIDKISEIIKKMWSNNILLNNSGAGKRVTDRVKHLFPLSDEYFSK